jgi:hypothetical protein
VKGLGYALEAMMASVIVFLFIYGAVEVSSPDQNWNDYQRQIAAEDLTYTMKESGKLNSFMKRGETGTLQNSMALISDRDMEVSGAISNLPISQIDIGYFTVPDKRIDQNIVEVGSGDRCNGDLQDIEEFAETDEIYRTDGNLEDNYGVRLYFANTNPTGVEDAEASAGFDSLWVDNGTEQCQFASEDGPHYLDQMFYWGDDNTPEDSNYYEFNEIDVDSGSSTFYRASQAHNISDILSEEVNGIATSTSMDMTDFDEMSTTDYSLIIFPERDSLSEIDSNYDQVISHLVSNPVLLLMNPEENDIENNQLLDDAGLSWIDTGYQSSYSGGEVSAAFSSERKSLDLQTVYTGLDGSPNFDMVPPGKVVSNTTDHLEASRMLYSPSLSYNLSEWNDQVNGMNSHSNPETSCNAFEGTANFHGYGNVDVLNVGLGPNCPPENNWQTRGLIIDFEGDGYSDNELHLNGERVIVENRQYAIDLSYNSGSDTYSEDSVEFIALGQDNVELMPNTASFNGYDGDRLAMLGHQNSYSENQRKAVSSAIYWLVKDEVRFEGREDPKAVSTSVLGGIDGRAYMPYEVNLRWSE